MEEYIKYSDKSNEGVSKGSIGWHIAHTLKVIGVIHNQMQQSNPEDYKKEFNLLKSVIFLTGKIPRGKVRSPKSVLPEENKEEGWLELQLKETLQKLQDIEAMEKNSHFMHPYFKQLNKPQTLKFLRIHTEHHLKILRDILEK